MQPSPMIIIDTETSGLFDFSKPADAEGQPRLASFAAIYLHPDFTLDREYSRFIKPQGCSMTPETTAINGLTNEKLEAEGVPVEEVLSEYNAAIDTHLVIAFNVQFDSKVMRGEMRRAGQPDRFETTRTACLMRPLTNICQIPKARGKGWKFPKLAEAMAHFKLAQEAAHSALGDARAAADLLRHCERNGIQWKQKPEGQA